MISNLPYLLSSSLFAILLSVTLVTGFTSIANAQSTDCLEGDSAIQCIRKRNNTLVVGIQRSFPPFGFEMEGSKLTGFDVELVHAMADLWGIQAEFVDLAASDRIPTLINREIDLLAAAMTHTRDRDALIDFSQTYFIDGQRLLVQKESGITGAHDLSGKVVAAVQGTTGFVGIEAFKRNEKIEFTIVSYLEQKRAIEAVVNGQADAFVTDGVALSNFAKENPDLIVVGDPLSTEPYGLGVRAGDSDFRNLVDATLQKLKTNGVYDALYEKWFSDLISPTIPYTVEISPGVLPYTITLWTQVGNTSNITSTVDTIKRDKKLVAGVVSDFLPFGARNEDDHCCIGFDIDLLREITKRWLGDDSNTTLELVEVNVNDRIALLQSGEVDIVAAELTHNWDRERHIDFSQTYFRTNQSLLVPEDTDIAAIENLQGKRVAATQGSTSIDQIRAFSAENQLDITVVSFPNHMRAIEALKNGDVAAFTSDKVALLQIAQEDPTLAVAFDLPYLEPYGIGLPNNDYQFRDLVNSTLQEMVLDGTYARLYEKWFGNLLAETAPPQVELWPRLSYTGVLGFSQTPMVKIPEGPFTRGNNASSESDETPEQQIELDTFYIDQYEVTNRLYRECVAAGECTSPEEQFSLQEQGDYYNGEQYNNFPVIWISWGQAQQYCTFHSKRLPTEAEWEKAARGPQGHLYPWGNTWLDLGFRKQRDPLQVGTRVKDVSGYGVYDMGGNVREWVQDRYGRTYYRDSKESNPQGPVSETRRVVRGGSWSIEEDAHFWGATKREAFQPETYANDLGFRCASDVPPLELVETVDQQSAAVARGEE